jgi:hypothetical protein
MPERYARSSKIIRGYLHVHFVAHPNPNEVLPHLTGNVGQDFVAVWQRNPKHRLGQNLSDRSQ